MTRGTLIYIIQRLLLISFTAVAISSIVFIGEHALLPGDAFVSERPHNPRELALLLHHFNLDLPLPQQHQLWVTGVLHGDLGASLVNRGPHDPPLLRSELLARAQLLA